MRTVLIWLFTFGAIIFVVFAIRDLWLTASATLDEHRRKMVEHFRKENVQLHEQRFRLELFLMFQAPIPTKARASGFTVQSADGTVHAVPIGYGAITICGLEITPMYNDGKAISTTKSYIHDPPGLFVVNCIMCLGRED